MLNFLYIAGGVAVLLVAAFLSFALYRLARVLRALEDTLLISDEAILQLVPEVRDSLGSVNDIAGGVNVLLRTAGQGANKLTQVAAHSSVEARSTLYGVKVGARSFLRSFSGLNEPTGDETNGRRQ